jgi:hypothetical protein
MPLAVRHGFDDAFGHRRAVETACQYFLNHRL